MRRNNDLLYDMLAVIEDQAAYAPPITILLDKLGAVPTHLVAGHLWLASDAGLIEMVTYGAELKPSSPSVEKIGNISLTMAGHDWLEAKRKERAEAQRQALKADHPTDGDLPDI